MSDRERTNAPRLPSARRGDGTGGRRGPTRRAGARGRIHQVGGAGARSGGRSVPGTAASASGPGRGGGNDPPRRARRPHLRPLCTHIPAAGRGGGHRAGSPPTPSPAAPPPGCWRDRGADRGCPDRGAGRRWRGGRVVRASRSFQAVWQSAGTSPGPSGGRRRVSGSPGRRGEPVRSPGRAEHRHDEGCVRERGSGEPSIRYPEAGAVGGEREGGDCADRAGGVRGGGQHRAGGAGREPVRGPEPVVAAFAGEPPGRRRQRSSRRPDSGPDEIPRRRGAGRIGGVLEGAAVSRRRAGEPRPGRDSPRGSPGFRRRGRRGERPATPRLPASRFCRRLPVR